MADVKTPSGKNILIVEDDTEISRLTTMLLESEGYACHALYRGDEAINEIRQLNPDLVVLDIMLPGKNGIEVCGEIREFYDGAVIMLTGQNDDITELSSFKQGADDFVTKPVKPHLLLARIEALLKRTQRTNSNPQINSLLVIGDLTLDTAKRAVSIQGKNIELTSTEFDVLEILAKQVGEVVSRECFCENLRGFSYDNSDRSIDMRISSLRKKLDAHGIKKRILTIRNRGYMLAFEEADL